MRPLLGEAENSWYALPEKLHPPPMSCSPDSPQGRISSVSRLPRGRQSRARRGSPLALRRKRLQGISSVAAGPCARVLSAGWNLHRDKTGFPSPKGAWGLRLRVSPRYPRPLAMGSGGWKGQAHRSPRHGGKLSGALVPAMPGPLLSVARGFAGPMAKIDDPIKLARPSPQGGTAVPNLGHKHAGRAAILSRGVSLAWGSPLPGRAHRPPGSRPWPHCRCETNTDAKVASLQCAAAHGHQD